LLPSLPTANIPICAAPSTYWLQIVLASLPSGCSCCRQEDHTCTRHPTYSRYAKRMMAVNGLFTSMALHRSGRMDIHTGIPDRLVEFASPPSLLPVCFAGHLSFSVSYACELVFSFVILTICHLYPARRRTELLEDLAPGVGLTKPLRVLRWQLSWVFRRDIILCCKVSTNIALCANLLRRLIE
jgi:hypothetical protein